MGQIKPFTFDEISAFPRPETLPPLDRESLDAGKLSVDQWRWWKNGYLKLENFIPPGLIEAYEEVWERENKGRLGGWPDCTPYLRHKAVKDLALYPPLMAKAKELIGEDMGVHLNLTGWVSTQRNWHQDTILNPDPVNDWYFAAWFALDDIHPDSGPFQLVPCSHKWRQTQRELLFKHIPSEWHKRDDWPTLTQDAVSGVFEQEIRHQKATIENYLPRKGDVLLWHARLAHRGSHPRNDKLLRKAFISHYSGLGHRPDMPERREHTAGCWYFHFGKDTNGNG